MSKLSNGVVIAIGLAGASFAATIPASAVEVVDVHTGPIGVAVSNGHYYDSNHRRQAYTYPADWKTYHHPQSWYRSHPQWNDQRGSDWYRN